MKYITQSNQSFDAETLRQELVAAIGPTGWYMNTYSDTVEFITTDPQLEDNEQVDLHIEQHFNSGLTRVKNRIWENIKTKRDSLVQLGGCKVGTDWYHSDTHSKMQQLTMSIKGVPANTSWKTMTGSFVPMTQQLIDDIVAAQMVQENAIFIQAEVHKAGLFASATPETYDYSTGWPETYI